LSEIRDVGKLLNGSLDERLQNLSTAVTLQRRRTIKKQRQQSVKAAQDKSAMSMRSKQKLLLTQQQGGGGNKAGSGSTGSNADAGKVKHAPEGSSLANARKARARSVARRASIAEAEAAEQEAAAAAASARKAKPANTAMSLQKQLAAEAASRVAKHAHDQQQQHMNATAPVADIYRKGSADNESIIEVPADFLQNAAGVERPKQASVREEAIAAGYGMSPPPSRQSSNGGEVGDGDMAMLVDEDEYDAQTTQDVPNPIARPRSATIESVRDEAAAAGYGQSVAASGAPAVHEEVGNGDMVMMVDEDEYDARTTSDVPNPIRPRTSTNESVRDEAVAAGYGQMIATSVLEEHAGVIDGHDVGYGRALAPGDEDDSDEGEVGYPPTPPGEAEEEVEGHDAGYGPAPAVSATPWLHPSSSNPDVVLRDHLAVNGTFMVQPCAPPAWYPTDTDGWYNLCVVNQTNIFIHQIRIDSNPNRNSMVAVEDGEEEETAVHSLEESIELLYTANSWWPVALTESVDYEATTEEDAVAAAALAEPAPTAATRWNEAVTTYMNDAEMMRRILDGDIPDEDEVDVPFNLAAGITDVDGDDTGMGALDEDEDDSDDEPDAGYGQSPHAVPAGELTDGEARADAAGGNDDDDTAAEFAELASAMRMERLTELSHQLEADTATYTADRRSSMSAVSMSTAQDGTGQDSAANTVLDNLHNDTAFERASAVRAADAVALDEIVPRSHSGNINRLPSSLHSVGYDYKTCDPNLVGQPVDAIRSGSVGSNYSIGFVDAVPAADAVIALDEIVPRSNSNINRLPSSLHSVGYDYKTCDPHLVGQSVAPAPTPAPRSAVAVPVRVSTVLKPAAIEAAEVRMLDTSRQLAAALAAGDAVLVKELRVLLYADVRLSSRLCRDATA
jgi:hypothetical protein